MPYQSPGLIPGHSFMNHPRIARRRTAVGFYICHRCALRLLRTLRNGNIYGSPIVQLVDTKHGSGICQFIPQRTQDFSCCIWRDPTPVYIANYLIQLADTLSKEFSIPSLMTTTWVENQPWGCYRPTPPVTFSISNTRSIFSRNTIANSSHQYHIQTFKHSPYLVIAWYNQSGLFAARG